MTYEVPKRLFDILFATIGLILLSPALIIVSIAVAIGSPGPVLYRGVRTGRFGKPFRILKFRSMVIDADKGAGSTAKDDDRITGVGKFIRRYKLDELPQLFNVLIGNMSFVGPRPELPRYTSLYRGDELLILSVKPGITDYSSINFIQLGDVLGEGDPDIAFEEKVLPVKNQLRVKYAREKSLLLDMRLIVQTILKIGKRNWST